MKGENSAVGPACRAGPLDWSPQRWRGGLRSSEITEFVDSNHWTASRRDGRRNASRTNFPISCDLTKNCGRATNTRIAEPGGVFLELLGGTSLSPRRRAWFGL